MAWFYVYVLFLHWIGDFVAQTRWMAENKSKMWEPLVTHVLIYSTILWFGLVFTSYWKVDPITHYVMLNFSIHLVTDFITSKVTRTMLENKDLYAFFVVLGFDQFIHALSLIGTIDILGIPNY